MRHMLIFPTILEKDDLCGRKNLDPVITQNGGSNHIVNCSSTGENSGHKTVDHWVTGIARGIRAEF